MKLIYLASPYSSPDPATREHRYRAVCAAAAHILKGVGVNVFSPIVHSHPLATDHGMAGDWQTWKTIDEDWIRRCDQVWVLKLDGWSKSIGVQAEIAFARSIRKRVIYIDASCADAPSFVAAEGGAA